MKYSAPIAAVIFAATLAYVVGIRLSESAMAVVIGVMFGVAASIPTSIVLILALRHTHGPRPSRSQETVNTPQPPTIIVTPPGTQPMIGPRHAWPEANAYLPPLFDDWEERHQQRRFHIVGDDEE